jgi:hypothetical protein
MKGTLKITKEELSTILALHFDCDETEILSIEFKEAVSKEMKKFTLKSSEICNLEFNLS